MVDPKHVGDYISQRLWIPQEELENIAGESDVWTISLVCCHRDPASDKRKKMDGWINSNSEDINTHTVLCNVKSFGERSGGTDLVIAMTSCLWCHMTLHTSYSTQTHTHTAKRSLAMCSKTHRSMTARIWWWTAIDTEKKEKRRICVKSANIGSQVIYWQMFGNEISAYKCFTEIIPTFTFNVIFDNKSYRCKIYRPYWWTSRSILDHLQWCF